MPRSLCWDLGQQSKLHNVLFSTRSNKHAFFMKAFTKCKHIMLTNMYKHKFYIMLSFYMVYIVYLIELADGNWQLTLGF